MRKLTIKRTKSFVGCLAKIKVYIEDHASSELLINNTPCRKIGVLKNGQEMTFEISDQAAKVFVIADKLSKDYCNEYYQLPEGEEDIFLSGKNEFNPASGNAFRFDNNASEEVIANRRRGTKKGIIVLIVAAVLGAIIGFVGSSGLFFDGTPEAKVFAADGMTITLTDSFWEDEAIGYNVVYDSSKVAVFALKEPFSLMEGFEDYTLSDYANLLIKTNGVSSAKIKTNDGLTYFDYKYKNPETNDDLTYFCYVYKSDDAFWMVQFATLTKNVDEYAPQITEWAKSVSFNS